MKTHTTIQNQINNAFSANMKTHIKLYKINYIMYFISANKKTDKTIYTIGEFMHLFSANMKKIISSYVQSQETCKQS